jgi:predicted DNA-binding protein
MTAEFPKVITLRLSETQRERLREKATKDKRPVGEIVRELIDDCLAGAK